jgi:hypothetical protein
VKAAKYFLGCTAILAVFSGALMAQSVISAKSGQINYTEGKVLLDGKEVHATDGLFPQMKTNQQLVTQDSRAEMLLSPGVILRAGEDSKVNLLSDRLEDTRVELVGGSIIVDDAVEVKGDSVTLVYKDAAISLVKSGLYRLDSDPAQLRVYAGEATVAQGGQTVTVRKAQLLPLNGSLVAEKFDPKTGDALLRWAQRRSEYVAMANPSTAQAAGNSFMGGNSWLYNPYFGSFTFVPGSGVFYSPFGFSYWSPSQVGYYYNNVQAGFFSPGSGGYTSDRAYSSSSYAGLPSNSSGASTAAAVSSPGTATSSGSSAVGHSSGAAGGTHR